MLELKDSSTIAISKINSPLVDNFLKDEVFISSEIRGQFKQSTQILEALFPDLLTTKTAAPQFFDSLKNHSSYNYKAIMKTLDSIISKRPIITGDTHDFLVYEYPYWGYIFLILRT